jgi:hypothetical protein
MKFNHADHRSTKRLFTCLSFARLGCIMGCVFIAFLGNIRTVRYGTTSSDLIDCAGLSHTSDSGPINYTDDDNLLPTEAFLSSEQKDDPFLLLLSLRERCDSYACAWMRSCVAWPQTRGRAQLYQESSRTSLIRILHSVQLRC